MTRMLGTVMILDDEPLDQMIYKRVIDRSGLANEVLKFTYPDEALEFLAQPDRQPVDVLLVDVNMPRMSGFEFIEKAAAELGRDLAKVTVVMLTTSLDPSEEARAQDMPAVSGFLNKPLMTEDLQRLADRISQDGT